MKPFILSMLALGLFLGMSGTNKAAAQYNTVTVWLLEVRYTPTDTWHSAGKYYSYADAQQSYVVRARHGGYTEMRIRQAVERQYSFSSQYLRNSTTQSWRSLLGR